MRRMISVGKLNLAAMIGNGLAESLFNRVRTLEKVEVRRIRCIESVKIRVRWKIGGFNT